MIKIGSGFHLENGFNIPDQPLGITGLIRKNMDFINISIFIPGYVDGQNTL